MPSSSFERVNRRVLACGFPIGIGEKNRLSACPFHSDEIEKKKEKQRKKERQKTTNRDENEKTSSRFGSLPFYASAMIHAYRNQSDSLIFSMERAIIRTCLRRCCIFFYTIFDCKFESSRKSWAVSAHCERSLKYWKRSTIWSAAWCVQSARSCIRALCVCVCERERERMYTNEWWK